MYNKPKLSKDLPDFSKDIDALVKYISQNWTGLKKIKPKGYAEFIKDYEDFKGQEEFDVEKACKSFKGFDDSTASSFSFPLRVALPYVAYDDICQGRDPFRTLVAALIGYGMARGNILAQKEIEDIKNNLKFIKTQLDHITE
jgi:hypothetical protein